MYKKIILFFLIFSIMLFLGGCSKNERYSDFSPKDSSFTDFIDTGYSQEKMKQIKKELQQKLDSGKYNKITPEEVIAINAQNIIKEKMYKLDENLLKIKEEARKFMSSPLKGHTEKINALEMYNGTIISASSDKTVKIWDIDKAKLLSTLTKSNNEIYALSHYRDTLAVGDGIYINLWDLKTKKMLKRVKTFYSSYGLKLTKTKIIAATYDKVSIFDRKSSKKLYEIPLKRAYAIAVNDKKLYVGHTKGITVIDIASGKTIQNISTDTRIIAIDFMGKNLVSAGKDKTVRIWKVKSGRIVKELQKYSTSSISSLIAGKSGVIIAKYSRAIELWSPQTNEVITTLKENSSFVKALAADRRYIITGRKDGTISIWYRRITKEKEAMVLGGKIKSIKKQIATLKSLLSAQITYNLKDLQLKRQTAYKHGKIGEYYVPSTTYSSSTPKTQTTYINGKAYTSTTYEKNKRTYSGHTKERKGYKAIIKFTNNSEKYYLLTLQAKWTGKYTTVKNYKDNSWGGSGDYKNKWSSKKENSSLRQDFLLKPQGSYKFQTEVGETKAAVSTKIIKAMVVDKEYYDALVYALDNKNRATTLINKFLADQRLEAWHGRLLQTRAKIKKEINAEFSKENIKDTSARLIFPKDYDPDFSSDITLEVSAGKEMCVYYKAPFGSGKVYASEGFWTKKGTKTVSVKNIPKSTKITITAVTESCDF